MPALTFEAFEIELQNTLYNLSDPVYMPEVCVFQALDVLPTEGVEGVRKKLIEVIEQGAQNLTATETAKLSFLFRVLYHRFVQSLSQEKAAEVLDISARHLRRKQNEAIRALAVRLWSQGKTAEPEEGSDLLEQSPQNQTWADMLLHEIEVLNNHSSGITVDLGKVIQKTVDMARYLQQNDGISIEVDRIPEGSEIAVHPNVLRQAILYIFRQIVQAGYSGQLKLSAKRLEGFTSISFTLQKNEEFPSFAIAQIKELASVLGGKAEILFETNCCSLDLIFPNSYKINVLVVDDNYETVQLFRRFTLNSRFEIFHFPGGTDLFEQIQAVSPNILVMDVLLPGQDGWDLLIQIRQNPATSLLPVIVSSVMGDPEIAHSLGANSYLPKPVDQKSFLRALEESAR